MVIYQISLAIKRYVQVGGEIQEGNDITSAIENTAGTSVAHIELNRGKFLIIKDKKKSIIIIR